MSDQFVTMVSVMRESQKEYADLAIHLDAPDRAHRLAVVLRTLQKQERDVDGYIQRHITEQYRLELWVRGEAKKTNDVEVAYTVKHEEAKKGSA